MRTMFIYLFLNILRERVVYCKIFFKVKSEWLFHWVSSIDTELLLFDSNLHLVIVLCWLNSNTTTDS